MSVQRLLIAFALLAPGARAEDESRLFLDAIDVHVVNVEVMVTDGDGLPVTGLTAADFELLEDGRKVALSNFYAVEGGEIPGAAGAPSAAGEDPGAVGAADAPRVETRGLRLVILVDEANLSTRNRNALFHNLERYLRDELEPGDQVMLVRMKDSVETVHGFTDRPEDLLPALDRMAGDLGRFAQWEGERRRFLTQLRNASLPYPPRSEDAAEDRAFDGAINTALKLAGDARSLAERSSRRSRRAARALSELTDSLAGLAGRKAVLYLSDGLATRGDSLIQAWLAKYEQWILTNDVPYLMQEISALDSFGYDATRELRELVERATANRVAFYPISNAGRGSSLASVEYRGAGSASDVASFAVEARGRESALLELAAGTGGIAFTRTADVDGLLERLRRDFDTFYSLGYNSPASEDGELHEIEVKVRQQRKGLEVRHFEGFREKDPFARLRDLTLSALEYSVEDNPLEVRLAPGEQVETGEDRYRVEVILRIPYRKLLLLPEGGYHIGRVSACVVARDDRGRTSPAARIELPIRVPNDRILQATTGTAAYPIQLEMRPGPQRLAVGVRDQLGGTDATVHVDLVVGERDQGG